MEIQIDQNPEYSLKLKSLLDSSKQWDKEKSIYELENAQIKFMDKLGVLYLEYFQFHPEEAKVSTIDYQEHLPKIADSVNRIYIYTMWALLNGAHDWDENWEFACRVMTNIEAFHTLFSDITGRLKDSSIVDFVEERRGSVMTDREAIPKNVPQSHWWWFEKF